MLSKTTNKRKRAKRKYPTPHQLLAVLKYGADITFPNGYRCHGTTDDGYISTYINDAYDGLWTLNLEGATNCIKEAKKMDKENKE